MADEADDSSQWTLEDAARQGRTAIVEALLAKGANANPFAVIEYDDMGSRLNSPRGTPLIFAAQGGHTATVKALLEKGADPYCVDNFERDALSWAAEGGHTAIVEALLAKYTDEMVQAELGGYDVRPGGLAPLHFAAEKGHTAIIEALLAKGAHTEVTDRCEYLSLGRTPLSWAAKSGHTAAVEALLAKGADAKAANEHVETALHFAAQAGHTATVKALLEKGADPYLEDKHGNTALPWAAEQGHTAVIEVLLAKGVDGKAANKAGRTPLHWAAQRGHTVAVEALLAKGADANAKDADGNSAIDLALNNKNPMCVAKLDPEKANELGDELRKSFRAAHTVHVLSTRFNRTKGLDRGQCTDPKIAAARTKLFLEEGRMQEGGDRVIEPAAGTKVFDPNADNAFLMGGNSEAANGIWLRNWREIGLENARKTGGWCIQVLVQGGMSDMQVAEADMARDKGVPIIRIYCMDLASQPGNLDYANTLVYLLMAMRSAMETQPRNYSEPIEVNRCYASDDGQIHHRWPFLPLNPSDDVDDYSDDDY